jgi:peptide/nickel transport system ATP-binding protein
MMTEVVADAPTETTDALVVSGLAVETADGRPIVSDFSLTIGPGEIVGLVGETGSGKSTIGNALLAYARSGARISAGRVLVGGSDVLGLSADGRRAIRGAMVSYVPQDPATALNPALRIGTQLREAITVHEPAVSATELAERVAHALESVHLPVEKQFLRRFPHQLSGGQQQRVCLAMALVPRPNVIVFDEPTTGLDVTTQARVLDTIRDLCSTHQLGALYITHDLGVVADLADRVVVMYAGRVVETGPSNRVFQRPAHPYTMALITSSPDIARPRRLAILPGESRGVGASWQLCEFAPRCALRAPICDESAPPTARPDSNRTCLCHRAQESRWPTESALAIPSYRAQSPVLSVENVSASRGTNPVLMQVSLNVARGECVALVGESGSGKTTLARLIVGLAQPSAGRVTLDGATLDPRSRNRSTEDRRGLQYIFQNPYASLNPRKTIGEIVGAPARFFFDLHRKELRGHVVEALGRVTLSAQILDKYPDELSGGERQRVAIARALVCKPKVLVCDEITSALDVSVQAAIVGLLGRLQAEEHLSILFITHNLALVRSIATQVTVLRAGRVTSSGTVEEIFAGTTQDAYTQRLLRDSPSVPRFDLRNHAGLGDHQPIPTPQAKGSSDEQS